VANRVPSAVRSVETAPRRAVRCPTVLLDADSTDFPASKCVDSGGHYKPFELSASPEEVPEIANRISPARCVRGSRERLTAGACVVVSRDVNREHIIAFPSRSPARRPRWHRRTTTPCVASGSCARRTDGRFVGAASRRSSGRRWRRSGCKTPRNPRPDHGFSRSSRGSAARRADRRGGLRLAVPTTERRTLHSEVTPVRCLLSCCPRRFVHDRARLRGRGKSAPATRARTGRPLLSVAALPYNPADFTYALAKRVLCLLRSIAAQTAEPIITIPKPK